MLELPHLPGRGLRSHEEVAIAESELHDRVAAPVNFPTPGPAALPWIVWAPIDGPTLGQGERAAPPARRPVAADEPSPHPHCIAKLSELARMLVGRRRRRTCGAATGLPCHVQGTQHGFGMGREAWRWLHRRAWRWLHSSTATWRRSSRLRSRRRGTGGREHWCGSGTEKTLGLPALLLQQLRELHLSFRQSSSEACDLDLGLRDGEFPGRHFAGCKGAAS